MSNNSLDEQIKSAIEYVEHEFIEITNSTELPINEFIDSTFIPKLKERSPASDKAEGHVRIKGHTFYGKYRDGWSKKTAKFKKTDRG